MNKATIQQWHMFLAVAKYGGFAQASEKVFKSKSSVHRSVTKLEQTLNVSLLKVEGKKAQLTPDGRKVFHLAEKLLSDARNLESYVAGLTGLNDSSIKIAIDALFPNGILRWVLQSTSAELLLKQLEITQVSKAPFDDEAYTDVVLSVLKSTVSGYSVNGSISVPYVAVFGVKSLIFESSAAIFSDELNNHIEIRVGQDPVGSLLGTKNEGCWTVDKISSAIELVCEGIGYAWLPSIDVQDYIASGKLRKISFRDQPDIRNIDFYLNVRDHHQFLPGVKHIVHHFKHFESKHTLPSVP